MKLLSEDVQIILALLGIVNTLWCVALTFFATRKAEANVRRVASELILAFTSIAIELGRERRSKDGQVRPTS
jgi:hypothetical protein